jgi:hypothetical protein
LTLKESKQGTYSPKFPSVAFATNTFEKYIKLVKRKYYDNVVLGIKIALVNSPASNVLDKVGQNEAKTRRNAEMIAQNL